MKLKTYIYETEMTTKEFARKAGVDYQILCKVMRGENVHWTTIQAIVKATEGSVSYQELETKKPEVKGVKKTLPR